MMFARFDCSTCGMTIRTYPTATVTCRCGIEHKPTGPLDRAQQDRHRKAEARKRDALTRASVCTTPAARAI